MTGPLRVVVLVGPLALAVLDKSGRSVEVFLTAYVFGALRRRSETRELCESEPSTPLG